MAAAKKVAPGAKKAFVLAHPELTAPEIVAEAKKQGLSITESHVYNLRSVAKAKAAKTKAAKKVSNGSNGKAARHVPIPGVPDVSVLGTAFLDLLVTAMRPLVTEMISEEIRRRLS